MFDPSDIQRLVRNHFGAIFTTSGSCDFEEAIEVLDPVVSNEMNSHLQALVTDVLIQKVAKQLGGLKAPGEDGFSSIFYHELWHLVGASVCNTVRSFFKKYDMPPKLNKTLVTLIPKTTSPENLSQFRPISLCNFIYKIISKVLSNCFKSIDEQNYLPTIICIYHWATNSRLHGYCSRGVSVHPSQKQMAVKMLWLLSSI